MKVKSNKKNKTLDHIAPLKEHHDEMYNASKPTLLPLPNNMVGGKKQNPFVFLWVISVILENAINLTS